MRRKKGSKKLLYIVGSAGWLLLILALGRFWYMAAGSPSSPAGKAVTADSSEGKMSIAKIEVGPFDIHRRYRSMEGPFVDQTFTIADMIESGKIELPEPMVRWVEDGNAASMSGSAPGAATSLDAQPGNKKVGGSKKSIPAAPIGVVYADIRKRDLYWLKSIKLEVLDENGKTLPTAEFICHMNLDVDSAVRDAAFKEGGQKVSNTRLITLTQGQTEFNFPEGYGLPVASFEPFRFTFQAANRTTDQHRRVKHLCTMEFIKDLDLKKPLVALAWFAPYIAVNIDKQADALAPDHVMHGPSCLGNSAGETAPNFVNGSVMKNNGGEHLVGHWAIPPGVHTYASPITDERDLGFNNEDRIVHCVWSHIHPMCNETVLNVCDGAKKTPMWNVHSVTDTSHGLEIKKIDDLYSKEGILLPKGKHYELSAKYANVSGQRQDSMVVQGIFYEDNKFVKPFFLPVDLADKVAQKIPTATTPECNSLYCGIKPPSAKVEAVSTSKEDYAGSDIYPLFDKSVDGPLLTDARHVQVHTSSGNLNFTFDPKLAPETATQIYRLFKNGAYGGSTICNYQPGYFLQIGTVDNKRNSDYRVPPDIFKLIKRLPTETAMQEKGFGLHKRWALDLTRNKAKDSGVSSFTIMLADEPHLDKNYTVFGHLDQDAESMATVNKIISQWSPSKQPYITGASDQKAKWTNKALAATVIDKPATVVAAKPVDAKAATTQGAPVSVAAKTSERNSEFPESLPMFDPKTDGPLLTSPKALTMKTSAGNIHIVLEPALAPANATQMYNLFKEGAFINTTISRYEPNFVLQTDCAEAKTDSSTKLNDKIKQSLRRLPLEVACQEKGQGLHKKYVLSMAHIDADANAATTSFSILLGDSPHLDHKYSVFGHVVPDAESEATLDTIMVDWKKQHPHVISVKPESSKIAFNSK